MENTQRASTATSLITPESSQPTLAFLNIRRRYAHDEEPSQKAGNDKDEGRAE